MDQTFIVQGAFGTLLLPKRDMYIESRAIQNAPRPPKKQLNNNNNYYWKHPSINKGKLGRFFKYIPNTIFTVIDFHVRTHKLHILKVINNLLNFVAPNRVLCLMLRVMHALIKTGKKTLVAIEDYRRQNGKMVLKTNTKSVAGSRSDFRRYLIQWHVLWIFSICITLETNICFPRWILIFKRRLK